MLLDWDVDALEGAMCKDANDTVELLDLHGICRTGINDTLVFKYAIQLYPPPPRPMLQTFLIIALLSAKLFQWVEATPRVV